MPECSISPLGGTGAEPARVVCVIDDTRDDFATYLLDLATDEAAIRKRVNVAN
ncbi:hypothetical protein AB0H00_13290 [Nocardia sp. NPDC023852]|uniref:hypothetical protein n=1 Tax=Nocardia sp. NPDC023852 TaxID=3154697 RepID=UPI0033E100A3